VASGVVVARLHGSNTVGEELAPALAEAFLKKRTGVATIARTPNGDDAVRIEARPSGGSPQVIEIEARGSGTGFRDLEADANVVAMSSRRIEAEEVKKLARLGDMTSAACENVLALDGIAIIENPANPVSKIAKDSLAKVFTGQITSWRDLGGRDSPITVYSRDARSGTLDLVKTLILAGLPIRSDATSFESSEKLSAAVAADANGIGFVGVGAVRSAKPVMLDGMGGTPLVPSPATIAAEDYPLTRRLYLYTAASASEDVRAFVEFALSDEGQQIVASTGFVDLRPSCEPRLDACARCPAAYTAVVAGACRASVTLRFDTTSGQLDTRGVRDLQRLSAMLRKPDYANKGILLAAFASGATPADALTRSSADADAVAGQLRARGLRVLSAKGYGGSVPVGDDGTAAGREKNRRVEIWLK
jgi:phosphate transport system substrate-binding protein